MTAFYAAMSLLDWQAGGTSDCFRVTSEGIPFGGDFGVVGSDSTAGGSTSTSGQGSVALPVGMASICNQVPSGNLDLMARSLNTAHG
jgi:hypothetical protein